MVARTHPLVYDINTRFDCPHSRFNDVPRHQMVEAGLRVLVHSDECGVLAATSPDGFRFLYFQGHPEYDTHSLLKEYKREVGRFVRAEREDYPPFPDHYFPETVQATLRRYRDAVVERLEAGDEPPPFPEETIAPHLDNTWTDTGKAIFNNWLGLVYQTTDFDRRKPFMPGIDPDDPLGLGRRG